jgi:hypothetical protein
LAAALERARQTRAEEIERERGNRITSLEPPYQQRMREIAAEYE